MLLSKGHLTGRALDSNPKPGCAGLQFTTPEIRFHQVPVKMFSFCKPLLQCQCQEECQEGGWGVQRTELECVCCSLDHSSLVVALD